MGLSEGAHLFEVRAVDEAGNVDAIPEKRSFTVDTKRPRSIASSPKRTPKSCPHNRRHGYLLRGHDGLLHSHPATTFKLFKKGSTTVIAAQ